MSFCWRSWDELSGVRKVEKSKVKTAVILVNYNGKKYNKACIESILSSDTESEICIYVADNASTDGSMELLREQFCGEKRVSLMPLDANYGFSYANNEGIRRAAEEGCDFFLLLNNDTEICADALEELLSCAKKHPESVIAPKICYSDNRSRIWSAGGELSGIVWKASHIGLDQEDDGRYDTEREIDFATGCALLIPKEVIRKAGMLDPDFFLYYEDTEYSLRLRKQGIPLFYCPSAVIYHKVGASSKGADSPLCAYYISRNWLLCAKKHMGGMRYLVFLSYYAVNRTVCGLLWLCRGRRDLVRAMWCGIRDFAAGKSGKTENY